MIRAGVGVFVRAVRKENEARVDVHPSGALRGAVTVVYECAARVRGVHMGLVRVFAVRVCTHGDAKILFLTWQDASPAAGAEKLTCSGIGPSQHTPP